MLRRLSLFAYAIASPRFFFFFAAATDISPLHCLLVVFAAFYAAFDALIYRHAILRLCHAAVMPRYCMPAITPITLPTMRDADYAYASFDARHSSLAAASLRCCCLIALRALRAGSVARATRRQASRRG